MIPVGLYEKALPSAWSWGRRLGATADAGYSFAEISVDPSDERLARLNWPARAKADLRNAIAATGVPILTMCLSAHRQYPLGSRVAATRERGLEIMRRAIDFSVDVGVRIVQVPGYDVFDEQPGDAGTVAHFMDGMHQAVEWAGQAGVMLALENVDVPMSESIVVLHGDRAADQLGLVPDLSRHGECDRSGLRSGDRAGALRRPPGRRACEGLFARDDSRRAVQGRHRAFR